ncbi:hypothetical protein GCM10023169_01230 [Georgenia halophila]|uniref:Antitoxin n=1 Tax=Georgenia halophila TaxID=620889 RepID=A0ABP8KTA7_9MICO
MPKVSVYLPDDMYRQVRERHLSLSALTQDAVEKALARRSLEDWIEGERHRAPRASKPVPTSAIMDEIRDEFGR